MKLLALFSDRVRQGREVQKMTAERALARRGEDLAHRFLQKRGYRVIARNYRTPSGGNEIDLIAWHENRLVFIEVKTRAPDDSSTPERAVTPEKRQRILRAAVNYAQKAKAEVSQLRFDIVAISDGRPPKIELFADAFGFPRQRFG